jgi:hypothetical protein
MVECVIERINANKAYLALILILLGQFILRLVISAGKRVSDAMDGKLKSIYGAWIPAQICLEQICINPKGVRQDSLT